jgi:hypothetical protein
MTTVLIKYKVSFDATHPLLNNYWDEKSQVVEVDSLLELNNMFERIISIKILK